jgi:menaquinone-dependent protoporphyrinogen oxidase
VIGDTLEKGGFEVTVANAAKVHEAKSFDAAVIGGALYANRWHRAARRFVLRNVMVLRRVPVWFFSSGPVDDSAERTDIPPVKEVSVYMERIGAQGHVTFGGCLAANVGGFTASAVAREHSGDFRNPDRIRAWAQNVADALPQAKPGLAKDHPAHSLARLGAHGFVGWALAAGLLAILLRFVSPAVSVAVHDVAAPVIFTLVSLHYFRARGAREPLFTAASFTVFAALFDVLLAGGASMRGLSTLASLTGTWLPLLLVFLATWATGSLVAMIPAAKPARKSARHQERGERNAHGTAGA